jgi:citrate lyase subunit beta/citryl-CoA lyase
MKINDHIKPRRSVLYMPASNVRAIDKARSLPVDCVILDLEDAVAPSMKSTARTQAMAAVRAGGFGTREVAIRINAFGTDWFEADFLAVRTVNVQAVVLPKVESAETVQHVADQLPEGMQLWAMIETPTGVQHVDAIALSHARLSVLVMGTSDLASELRVPHRSDRIGFLYALSRTVNAARVAGIDVIDGVCLDLEDEAAYIAICEQGRALGFDGKSLIHPKQIDVANRVFAPDSEAVLQAHRILACWNAAEASGQGVAVLDGKLVENLHAAEAERLLVLAEAIRQREQVV